MIQDCNLISFPCTSPLVGVKSGSFGLILFHNVEAEKQASFCFFDVMIQDSVSQIVSPHLVAAGLFTSQYAAQCSMSLPLPFITFVFTVGSIQTQKKPMKICGYVLIRR